MGKKGRRENPKRLGIKLVSIRNSLALSQGEMLRRLGISEEYTREEISAYERGVRIPPLHVLLKYSKVARVWVNVLIDDELDLPMGIPTRHMHEGILQSVIRNRGQSSVVTTELLGKGGKKVKQDGVKQPIKRHKK